VKYGTTLLHGDYFVHGRRPVGGSATLPAWTLVADEPIGQRLAKS